MSLFRGTAGEQICCHALGFRPRKQSEGIHPCSELRLPLVHECASPGCFGPRCAPKPKHRKFRVSSHSMGCCEDPAVSGRLLLEGDPLSHLRGRPFFHGNPLEGSRISSNARVRSRFQVVAKQQVGEGWGVGTFQSSCSTF